MNLIYHAKIYTFDPLRPLASALLSENGRIVATGDDETLLSLYDGSGTKFDAEGKTVLPGLIDAHIHLAQYGLSLQKVPCDTATRQECLERLAERARQTPAGEWISGHGWNQNDWPEGFGTADDLDQVTQEHPVYLTARSLHAAWVNHLALRLAGIDASTADPPGGRIGRDEHGEPNGLLFESAMQLVARRMPAPDRHQLEKALETAQDALLRMGVTGAHDFDQQDCLAALQSLHNQEKLKLRVVKGIPFDYLDEAIRLGWRTGMGDDQLRFGGVKVFADGALGPRTAAMLEPYAGEPANRGILLMEEEELVAHGQRAIRNGMSLAIHAIGDRANRIVLKALERLRQFEATQGKELSQLRHRIEHVQLIQPEDAGRLAEMGIIASMQPIHATSDMLMVDRFWGERAKYAYAWRTLLDHGTLLAFGSDAPVESPNPFWGIHAAITRQRIDGTPSPQGWYPQERIGLNQALSAYTAAPAYAANIEDRLGRLAVGYLADLVLLDRDPFTCSPVELHQVGVAGTMVSGEWVYLQSGKN